MNKYLITLLFALISITLFSQEVVKDTINTEEIIIVKPYTPKIKDAFKVKKSPQQNEEEMNRKKEVHYSINSVPVASTFSPAKGKAKGVARKQKERIYDNFASVAFGNYTTPKIELFAHSSTTRDNDFGALLNFHSSKGDVKDAVLNSNFLKGDIALFYKNSMRDLDWQLNAGYQYQLQNWYGLYNSATLTQNQIDAIDAKQVFNTIKIGGNIDYYNAYFKGAKTDVTLFTDTYKSNEIHALATPKFDFYIGDEILSANFRLEYLGGKFDESYLTNTKQEYGFYNLGLSPNLKILRDYFTINLGTNLVYSGATKNGDVSKFFIYPNVTASYELIQDVLTMYAGVTGDLNQNTYQNYVANNPFVSPTLNVRRTNEKYNAKVGTKGKLTSSISFNVNAFYKDENSKPFVKLNEDLSSNPTPKNYQYANSYNVVYDNVKTLGGFGEITVDVSTNFQLGGNLSYNNYTMQVQEEAWNLPALQGNVFGNYNGKKLKLGVNLFFVGDRKDQYINNSLLTPLATFTAKSYVDLNLNAGYNFNNRLSAFINGNNLLNSNYNKYSTFKVQGIQVLGGIKYKFDL